MGDRQVCREILDGVCIRRLAGYRCRCAAANNGPLRRHRPAASGRSCCCRRRQQPAYEDEAGHRLALRPRQPAGCKVQLPGVDISHQSDAHPVPGPRGDARPKQRLRLSRCCLRQPCINLAVGRWVLDWAASFQLHSWPVSGGYRRRRSHGRARAGPPQLQRVVSSRRHRLRDRQSPR